MQLSDRIFDYVAISFTQLNGFRLFSHTFVRSQCGIRSYHFNLILISMRYMLKLNIDITALV